MTPTPEYLKECLNYDPDTGIFTWKERPREHFDSDASWHMFLGKFAKRQAGSLNSEKYRHIQLGARKYKAHRVAWAISTGAWPIKFIDHINGDRDDNRLVNLRGASNAENCLNAKLSVTNKSGIKGVHWHKAVGKWQAKTSIGGVTVSFGFFIEKSDAAEAIRSARDTHHGVFASHKEAPEEYPMFE